MGHHGADLDPICDLGGDGLDRAVGHGDRDDLCTPDRLGDLFERDFGQPSRGSGGGRVASRHGDDRVAGSHPTDRDGGSHRTGPDDRDVHPATEGEYGNVEIQSNGPSGAGAPSGLESGRTDPSCRKLTVPSVDV